MDLKDYERAKFELADDLRKVEALATNVGMDMRGELRELFARLAEDRFNLVVVGRFSRGNTSLMNALLGTDRLPTGILPLTSVITTVIYGSTERVVIRYQSAGPDTEVTVDELPDYITQQHNPGNVRHVRTAEVQLPEEILRRGFHFIDTPGLGSHIAENTQTTERFLPQADAFVLVTSYESAISEEELAVLNAASSSFRRVFIALNKHDTVSVADREEVLRYVNEQMLRSFGKNYPRVFSVSARDAIVAQRAHDIAGLAASGIPTLEEALTHFMLAEKRSVFLRGFCERLIDLAARLPQDESVVQLVGTLRTRARLAGDGEGVAGPIHHSVCRYPRSGTPTVACQICERVQIAVFDKLRQYQHELAVSVEAQSRHAKSGGLCRMHMRQYASLASPHDVCVGNAALIEWLSSELQQAAASLGRDETLNVSTEFLLAARQHCPLCLCAARAEMQAIATIVQDMSERGEGALGTVSLICVSHLARVLPALDEEDFARPVLMHESRQLDRLAEDMRRYATKHDAIRRYLASEEESKAAQTAVAVLAGLPNGHVNDG